MKFEDKKLASELDKWMLLEIYDWLGDIPDELIQYKDKLKVALYLAGVDKVNEEIQYIILLN